MKTLGRDGMRLAAPKPAKQGITSPDGAPTPWDPMSRMAEQGVGQSETLEVLPDSVAPPNWTLEARPIASPAGHPRGGRQDVRLAGRKILYNHFTLVCGARGGVEGVGSLRWSKSSTVAGQSWRRRAPARLSW